MSNLINLYPNTNYSEINLDYIITLVRQNAGLHLELSGNQLLLKTLDGSTVSAVTVAYATEAGHADTATNAINATYATSANSASTATNATNAGHALTADSATTAGTATTATTATTAGTATEATHATTADTALNANNATHATSADYADTTGTVEHASNAFEAVSANGLKTRFTRGDGSTVDFDVPSAIKADRDTQNNQISTTYIATVEDDNGTLKFKNAIGTVLFSITPSAQSATEDSYGNTIADFIKAIVAPSDSNYVTVTHGTGEVDTLTVNYSNQAWKDTNGNVIKNFYIGSLEIVKDSTTNHYNLVCYNGDTPRAELFRVEINAYKAQLAEEANHATNADYATNAGTASEATHATSADTATTSTGSVSSITRNRNILTINNGDGTSSTVDLFRNSQRYLWVKQSINNNTELLDSTFTVGHSEEFGIDNYNIWGYDTAFQAVAEGAKIDYVDANSYGLFSSFAQKGFALDNGNPYTTYQIFVFDTVANALKCFEITPPADDELTPGNITITRLL